MLGTCRKEQFPEAVIMFNRAIRNNGTVAASFINRGDCYRHLRQTQLALGTLCAAADARASVSFRSLVFGWVGMGSGLSHGTGTGGGELGGDHPSGPGALRNGLRGTFALSPVDYSGLRSRVSVVSMVSVALLQGAARAGRLRTVVRHRAQPQGGRVLRGPRTDVSAAEQVHRSQARCHVRPRPGPGAPCGSYAASETAAGGADHRGDGRGFCGGVSEICTAALSVIGSYGSIEITAEATRECVAQTAAAQQICGAGRRASRWERQRQHWWERCTWAVALFALVGFMYIYSQKLIHAQGLERLCVHECVCLLDAAMEMGCTYSVAVQRDRSSKNDASHGSSTAPSVFIVASSFALFVSTRSGCHRRICSMGFSRESHPLAVLGCGLGWSVLLGWLSGYQGAQFAVGFTVGFALYTFTEYFIHRVLFHVVSPLMAWPRRLYYKVHHCTCALPMARRARSRSLAMVALVER